jgi:hypothetical protein
MIEIADSLRSSTSDRELGDDDVGPDESDGFATNPTFDPADWIIGSADRAACGKVR